jgi:hypothetical protein
LPDSDNNLDAYRYYRSLVNALLQQLENVNRHNAELNEELVELSVKHEDAKKTIARLKRGG